LLRAIENLPSVAPTVRVIVRNLLGRDMNRYRIDRLTEIAAGENLRPRHAKIIFSLLVETVSRSGRGQVAAAVPRLKRHGYFAALLQSCESGNLQHQVDDLTDLLGAVHGEDLSADACGEILAGGQPHAPTVALLLAVFRLAAPGNATGILSSFMLGLMRSAELSSELRAALAEYGPWETAEQGSGTEDFPSISSVTGEDVITAPKPSATIYQAHEHLADLKEQDASSNRRESLMRQLLNPGSGIRRNRFDHGQE